MFRHCDGTTDVRTQSELGLPADASTTGRMLEDGTLLVASNYVGGGPPANVALLDPRTATQTGAVELREGERLFGVDGRSYFSTLRSVGASREFREYDSSGAEMSSLTEVPSNPVLREELAEGWLLVVNGDGQARLLLDGALASSERLLSPGGLTLFKAGTPLGDERRFLPSDERPDETTLRAGFSEVDGANEVLWASEPMELFASGRGSPACRSLMTDTNAWRLCRFLYGAHPVPGSLLHESTTLLLRYDAASGDELERYVYETQSPPACDTRPNHDLLPDRCDGAYVLAIGPTFSATCGPNGGAVRTGYVIDHYGPDGARD